MPQTDDPIRALILAFLPGRRRQPLPQDIEDLRLLADLAMDPSLYVEFLDEFELEFDVRNPHEDARLAGVREKRLRKTINAHRESAPYVRYHSGRASTHRGREGLAL